MFNFTFYVLHVGWATDLRTVSEEMIAKRVQRTGDGSHKTAKELKAKGDENNNNEGEAEKDSPREDLWGWGNGHRF